MIQFRRSDRETLNTHETHDNVHKGITMASDGREAINTRMSFRPPEPDVQNSIGYRCTPSLEETEVGKPVDWQPVFLTILLGARDMHSPLSLLRGKENDIIRNICGFLPYKYKEGAVTITPPAYSASRMTGVFRRGEEQEDDNEHEREVVLQQGQIEQYFSAVNVYMPYRFRPEVVGPYKHHRPQIAFSPCGRVDFPEPKDININMMPFVMGNRNTLPTELRPYYDKIISKCPVAETEKGDVMYLTVQESFIEEVETQRRPGLHIEAPSASASHPRSGNFVAGTEHRWGMGMAYSPDEIEGGLYLASNTSNTTAVWDALVDPKFGAVDTHGGIEHLRPYIGKGKKLPAGLLVWLTDHTPHEALPQQESGYRQFFRLVTGNVSVWFAAQSTPNPKVPVPSHVRVIGESKFATPSEGATRIYTDEDFIGDDIPPWAAEKQKSLKARVTRTILQVEPTNLFREADEYKGKYSAYDGKGVPTHLASGTKLCRQERKMLLKAYRKHMKQK